MATAKSKALKGEGYKNEKYIKARENLIKKDKSAEGHLGISDKGVYRHNPKTGFNERVNHRTGKFTGKGAY